MVNKRVILGSASPRRSDLLRSMRIPFEVVVKPIEETYPDNLTPRQIVEYLARKKAAEFKNNMDSTDIVITADTIVSYNDNMLHKPLNKEDAIFMLKTLSGKQHEVITGVSIMSGSKQVNFHAVTYVTFSDFTEGEINYYVNNFEVLDKAGAYGIQDWIGLIGVKEIKGSYYNVVGLPTNKLFQHLKEF
ncbi:MAG: septum formation protein Maf [Crocinitomicaceae bacterium]|nr:septum formation protein Maf [Crocinitomicaceae bacterium]